MSFDNNKHLKEVLDTHKMCHVQDFVNKVKKRREEIKAKMHNHYGSDKYPSFESGSFAKHTATNVKFDLDLVEPFKRNAFGTLQEMFDSVHDFLAEEYKNTGVTIRRQKVSIGVSFPIEEGDEKPVELDVVPGRELSDDNYLDSHDLNLCFNEDHWGFKRDQARKRISRSRFRISKVSRVSVKLFVCLKYGKSKKIRNISLSLLNWP